MTERDEQRPSLYGITPEEALRALLAVNPEDPPVEDDTEAAEAENEADDN